MIKAEHTLRKFWGFEAFKPSQESVIASVLDHNDTLALLPTGGGKSLCFQVPAMVNEGICIVVSPLIALMQDQVNVLKSKGIKAMALTSGMPYSDLDAALDNCIYGNYKFLYLSPERLQQNLVQERIKAMNVNLIAIDEAHCISQWGHDFRPAYREIKVLRELHPSVSFLALTATAKKEVQQDIIELLDLYQPKIVKQSFKRENLALRTLKSNNKYQSLLRELNGLQGSAIIYLRNRKSTLDVSNFLNTNNLRATNYHGGITNTEKKERLEQWLDGTKQIMVATNAFGMGIDKADVRKVIHFNFADSLESYYQEAGRAGRDGNRAEAVIIYNDSDTVLLHDLFLKNLPNVEAVKYVYSKLNSFFRIAFGEGEDETFSFNFYEFCQHYQLNTLLTYQILQTLDRASVLTLTQRYAKKSEVQFIISNKQLLYFVEENPKYEPIIKAILRSYGGIFEAPVSINLLQVLSKAGTYEKEALQLLKELDEQKIITFEFSKHDAQITFLKPREDDHTINPLIPYINQQKTHKERQISSFLNYVKNNTDCKMVQLLHYFDEEKGAPCGMCSVCISKKQDSQKTDFKSLKEAIFFQLKRSNKTSKELSEAINLPKQTLLQVLSLLMSEELIMRTSENTYKLR
jgi:ATP-dependent DNA helicase RecQ